MKRAATPPGPNTIPGNRDIRNTAGIQLYDIFSGHLSEVANEIIAEIELSEDIAWDIEKS